MFGFKLKGHEKRRHPRVVPLPTAPVEVQVMGLGFLDVLKAQDISVGGLALRVRHRFEGCEIDRGVNLIVTLPGQRPFMARGSIRHLVNIGHGEVFGVKFAELPSNSRVMVERYVEDMLALHRGLER